MPMGAARPGVGSVTADTAGPASSVRRVTAMSLSANPSPHPLSTSPVQHRNVAGASPHAEGRLVDLEQLLLLGAVVRFHASQLEDLAQRLDIETLALGLREHVLDLIPGIALLV